MAKPPLSKLQQRMLEKLQGGQFRYINEQLYTQSGAASFEMMQREASLFEAVRWLRARRPCSHRACSMRVRERTTVSRAEVQQFAIAHDGSANMSRLYPRRVGACPVTGLLYRAAAHTAATHVAD